MTLTTLIMTAALLPLFSSLLIIFFGKKVLRQRSAWFATGVMGVSFILSFIALVSFMAGDGKPQTLPIPWIPVGGGEWISLGILVDGLCVAMFTMVTMISTLVHLYSIGYMQGDKRYERFFAYLSFFTFSMLGIVAANSIMQLFVFWELVGFASYLLIGFWFEKRGPQLASKKAFVMNRIGDMGFLIGFGILFYQLGSRLVLSAPAGDLNMFLQLEEELRKSGYSLTNPPMWLTAAGIALFFGAIGKSAQFPLHTWLPDAMEGPTPVSSIVHSATMVAAGVYLTARIYPILTPGAHLFIATIGLITLVMAALMALVMTDIKKVLAYSTLSQLGYMILALGAGSYTFALFHLITHAFFKCCLFQCAGSVIHAAHHQQDMRYYGGLKDKLPTTALCYFICTLAIAGASIPYTSWGLSGFYSKDGIIAATVSYGDALQGLGKLFWIGPMVVAYLTAFYMARSFALTFLGKPRDQHLYDHAHEAPAPMVISQAILALMAIVSVPGIWFSFIDQSAPTVDAIQATAPTFDVTAHENMHHGFHAVHAWLLNGFGWIIALGAGIFMYRGGMNISEKIVRLPVIKQLYTIVLNKFYFDALYDLFFVGVGKMVAYFAAAFDRLFVDNLVNLTGLGTVWSARGTGLIDNRIVDGIVNGLARFAQNSGQLLRQVQIGRVRAYVLVLFASAVVVTLIVVLVALVPDTVASVTP